MSTTLTKQQEALLRVTLDRFVREVMALLNETKEEVIQKEEGPVSKQTLLELIFHEAIVLEAYKDSVGVWTWGVGVTNNSGHTVYPRYKDNPESLKRVIEVFKWLVETKYLPDVLAAFHGFDLTEEQLAAALSFHYNTGAIKRASWVKSFKKGETAKAAREIMNWRSPKEIIPRREKERDLFFKGKWSNNGKAMVIPVNKPSYQPSFRRAKFVDISKEL